jgi:hypothetical protein
LNKKLLAAFAAFLLIAGAALAVVLASGGSSQSRETAAERTGEGDRDADREGKYGEDPRKEAAFENERGGEADRKGPQNPVVEQVDNRAYPRKYVDDRLALKGRKAFDAKPSRAKAARAVARRAKTARARRVARAAINTAWEPLGPVTPNVAGETSQFYDLETQSGPATQESGRVTAMAIDPNCGETAGDCRLWVASAGGGIWRTDDALAAHPTWIAPPDDLPTNAFGSIFVDPNDASGDTLYAGSGEPNGSGDSEAGLGLFKSTDGGASWTLVPGSQSVAINRSVGSIAVPPGQPNTIYMGTDVARHGSSSANGGRRTPPDAPDLGVYKSTDGGAHFTLLEDLHDKTPQSPIDPAEGTGVDWFQGGINKLEFDPRNAQTVYAAVIGYGVWRSNDAGAHWTQVFHTYYQSNFADPKHPGDTYGDRTEFDAVPIAGGKTRIYLGDSSDDLAHAWAWRTDDAAAITGDADGNYDNSGWTELSDSTNGTNGFGVYDWCQNGQCGYDSYVTSPPGHPDQVWYGGSMNYDELPLYAGLPPRSNGRATVRSTNAGAPAADVAWRDMTATLGAGGEFTQGLHPDLHAIAFNPQNPNIAFIGSDGGVHKVDVSSPQDRSHECDSRTWPGYLPANGSPKPLAPADLADCKMLLNGIPNEVKPINDGLATIQFQSLSVNPNGNGELLGGTQDNGTWAFTPANSDPDKWFESVGGDGGQSGFDEATPTVRYHNYYDATPEVNFEGNNPKTWLDIYDPLQKSKELRSFYTPFVADPVVGGRSFTGLGHVWRSDSNGGSRAYLEAHCNALDLDPARTSPCGNWVPLGEDLSSTKFGQSRAGHYVVADERAPSDRGTLWAGTRTGRVFITKNADASNAQSVKWDRLDTDDTPGRFVSGIAIDPSNPNHAWVSYSGYTAYSPGGHIYEFTYNPSTHKATATDRSYDFGDMPATGIAQDGGDLYAATDWGVLRLPAGASHWQDAAANMPKVAVYGLTIDRATHTLYAATHGRGAYKVGL